MLKTNSKKARENLRNYITENFNAEYFDIETPQTFAEIAAFILSDFERVKGHERGNRAELFYNWAAGLPSAFDTCYFYNRSAVDDLGDILEETDAERARFGETAAENLLTSLIYRELLRAAQ